MERTFALSRAIPLVVQDEQVQRSVWNYQLIAEVSAIAGNEPPEDAGIPAEVLAAGRLLEANPAMHYIEIGFETGRWQWGIMPEEEATADLPLTVEMSEEGLQLVDTEEAVTP